MIRFIFITSFLLSFVFLRSQVNVLSLEECQQKAKNNYPLIKQYDLINLSKKYNLENISKIYLPQVSLNGQASYQSDVIALPLENLPVPVDFSKFIPTMDKDQYKVTLDVQQLLWDGGATRSQSKIIQANSELEKQKLEVDLYAIRDKVNQLYFGVLSVDEQLKQLDVLHSDLQANYDLANAMLKNGVAMSSDLDLIKAEFLNLEQKKIELHSYRKACLDMLSLFIHEKIEDYRPLQLPEDEYEASEAVNRPEISVFAKQYELLDAQYGMIKAKNMPSFGLFLQGGYGRPGLNVMEPEFKLFTIGGIKLTWNFGNLYTRKNEKELIETNRNLTKTQEETFLFNTQVQLKQNQSEIEKYKKLIEKDNEIISLRSLIKKASQSKYKNGVYKMNDLIADTNAENKVRIEKSLHYIQYQLSIYNYKYTQGN